MKRIMFVALCIVLSSFVIHKSKDQNTTAQFNSTKHVFGKIKQGIPVTHVFDFKNSGSKALIIEVATAECGCTTPDYPKEPILAQKDGKIKVTYNAETMGMFSKKVTVKFTDSETPVTLTIEGEVVK